MPDGPLTPGGAAAGSEALCRLADILIPATHRMPAASSVEGGREWLHHVLTVRPDLLPVVQRLTESVRADDPAVVLRDLKENDPGLFLGLATVVIGAYYMNPVVRKLIGYPGQEPLLASAAEDGLGDDVLGPVVSRGPRHRQTPE